MKSADWWPLFISTILLGIPPLRNAYRYLQIAKTKSSSAESPRKGIARARHIIREGLKDMSYKIDSIDVICISVGWLLLAVAFLFKLRE